MWVENSKCTMRSRRLHLDRFLLPMHARLRRRQEGAAETVGRSRCEDESEAVSPMGLFGRRLQTAQRHRLRPLG